MEYKITEEYYIIKEYLVHILSRTEMFTYMNDTRGIVRGVILDKMKY